VHAARRPNIHLLGNRSYDELPAYVQAFDVGIIPYVLNDWTRSVDPLKLLEYLAAGIPVVTTAIPEVFKYAEAVRIADTRERFEEAVAASLTDTGAAARAARQSVARKHTWESRADRLIEIVEQVASGRARAV